MIRIATSDKKSLGHHSSVPSLDDIRARAAEIRARWSEEERAQRQRKSQEVWETLLAVQAALS